MKLFAAKLPNRAIKLDRATGRMLSHILCGKCRTTVYYRQGDRSAYCSHCKTVISL